MKPSEDPVSRVRHAEQAHGVDEALRVARELLFEARAAGSGLGASAALEIARMCWEMRAFGEAEQWARYAEEAAAGAPSDVAVARTIMLGALKQQGRLGDAAVEVEHGLPNLTGVDAIYVCQLRMAEAVAWIDVGRYEPALKRLDECLELSGSLGVLLRAVVQLNRGVALSGLGRTEDALYAYETALPEIDAADRPTVLMNIGNAHRTLENLDRAIAAYESALAEPADQALRGAVLSNLARVKLMIGDTTTAEGLFLEAIDVRRAAGDQAGAALSLYWLACLRIDQLRFDEALDLARQSHVTHTAAGLSPDQDTLALIERLESTLAALAEDHVHAARLLVSHLRSARDLDRWVTLVGAASPQALRGAIEQLKDAWIGAGRPVPTPLGQSVMLIRFLERVRDVGVEQAALEERDLQRRARGLVEAIRGFNAIDRSDWLNRKRYYQSRQSIFEGDFERQILLPPAGQTVIDGVDPDGLAEIAALVRTSQAHGIDAAFIRLPVEDEYDLINRFVTVGTWTESRQVLEVYTTELLSPESLAALDRMLTQATEASRVRLEGHRNVLIRCREIGIDAALIEAEERHGLSGMKVFQATFQLEDQLSIETVARLAGPALAAGQLVRNAQALIAGESIDAGALREMIGQLERMMQLVGSGITPRVEGSVRLALALSLVRLAEIDPEASAARAAGLKLLMSFLSDPQPVMMPGLVWTAAEGIERLVPELIRRVPSWQREDLRELRLRAAATAMDASDRLASSGTPDEDEVESVYPGWAYAAAVQELVALDRDIEALAASERGRARSFLNDVARMDVLPEYVPPQLASRESAARQQLRQLRGQADLSAVTAAETELANAAGDVAHIAPDLASIRIGHWLSAVELQGFAQSLPVGLLALSWFVTPTNTYVFAVEGGTGSVTSSRLSIEPDALLAYVQLAVTDLWHRPTRADQAVSSAWSALGTSLVPPELGPMVRDATSVWLLPHGPLHELPLHALPLEALDGRCLVEHTPTQYAPSLNVARHVRGRRPRSDGDAVLIAHPRDDGTGEPSEFAREVAAIARTIGAGVGEHGSDVTVHNIAARSRRAAIVHIAAHGIFDAADPLDSGLILPGRDGDNVLLSARGVIRTFRLPGSLVVLSGCDTNRRSSHIADNHDGLVRAFLLAGASAVVASQWPVDSACTAALMIAFHDHYAAHASVAGALRAAMLAIRGHPETAHPFYWAPFVAAGAG